MTSRRRWFGRLAAWLPGLVAASALAVIFSGPAGFDDTPAAAKPASAREAEVASATDAPNTPESLLTGTWLRQAATDGVSTRHLLTLGADHRFQEDVSVTSASGQVSRYRHEGTWLHDGTNLKRKYVSMDGKPPSRLNLPFATFEIRFDSPDEFHGVDHIHGNTIRYRRVAPGTQQESITSLNRMDQVDDEAAPNGPIP